jgi:hypothetical protein
MGWIDYQKAYDLVSHSWIIEALRIVGVDEKAWGLLVDAVSSSMNVYTAIEWWFVYGPGCCELLLVY